MFNTSVKERKSLRLESKLMPKLVDNCVFIEAGSESPMSHCDFLKNTLRVKRNTHLWWPTCSAVRPTWSGRATDVAYMQSLCQYVHAGLFHEDES